MDGMFMLALQSGVSLSGHFTWIDWLVLVGYLAVVSVLGVWLAGRQRDMGDFFRGGNRLPWYAVAGSMIATIVSAVTFIGVPAIIYRDGGNFTYLQFGIVAGLLSRLFVAMVLVPAYYRYEIYSPYDYMGRQLGEAARSVTTAMFTVLGLLSQAARVYLTAMILGLILHDQLESVEAATGVDGLVWSIGLVGVIAIAWTMLGGIATVIWTDLMLFIVFVVGGLAAVAVIVGHLPGGLGQLVADAAAADKFILFNLDARFDATQPYTLWAAFFAVTFNNIGVYGTDQLLAQRIFCCKNQAHAKAAVLASWAGELVVALMLLVGAGLWVFYREFPQRLTGEGAAAVAENLDHIFPVFILTVVPVGLTGLIVAGIFAAAISSLTSILAALSQTTLSAVYLPLRKIDPETGDASQNREVLLVSRGLVVLWGVALCGAALGVHAYIETRQAAGLDTPFLDLALGLGSYVVGGLLAAFLLAWLPLRVNAYGLIWSAPLSVVTVFAARFHEPWAQRMCWGAAAVLVVTWIAAAVLSDPTLRRWRLLRVGWLVAGCGVMVAATYWFWFDVDGVKTAIAWPWYAPIGGAVALVWGWLLADSRTSRPPEGGSGTRAVDAESDAE